jgi:hypothetical protein
MASQTYLLSEHSGLSSVFSEFPLFGCRCGGVGLLLLAFCSSPPLHTWENVSWRLPEIVPSEIVPSARHDPYEPERHTFLSQIWPC